MKELTPKLSQFSIQLTCEVGNKFLHDGIDLLVVESLLLVLQNEVHCVALLALWQVLALIHVEENHALEELLLCLTGDHLYLLKLHTLVDQECQVAAYRRILADIGIGEAKGGSSNVVYNYSLNFGFSSDINIKNITDNGKEIACCFPLRTGRL